MMRSRWLSTFTLLGILLVILGLVGKILGPRFIYDPGQIPDGNEAWCYLIVGALMILNGLLSPLAARDDAPEPPVQSARATTTRQPVTAVTEERPAD